MTWEEIAGAEYAREVIPGTLLIGMSKLEKIYEEGVEKGVFRKNIDLEQLILSINALCLITFVRLEMLRALWQEKLEKKLEERLEHIYELVLKGITTK